MAITPTTFRERFPEFTDPPNTDARVQIFIDKAVMIMNEATWGDCYNEGQNLLVAHFLAYDNLRAQGGGAAGSIGPVTSQKVGDVAVTFGGLSGASTTQENYFKSTAYGQEYWWYVQDLGVAMLVV